MRKKKYTIIFITLIVFFTINTQAENLSKFSTVNDYISSGNYKAIGINVINDKDIIYHLSATNIRVSPKIISCIYSVLEETTLCLAP